jgi:hypothetical protein
VYIFTDPKTSQTLRPCRIDTTLGQLLRFSLQLVPCMQLDSSQAAHSPVKHRKDVNIASGNVRKYASRPFRGLYLRFCFSEDEIWKKTGMAGHIQHEEVWDRLWPAVCQPNSAVFGLFPIVMVAKPDMTWNRHWLHWRKSEGCEMQTIQLTAWGSANLPRWSKMHRSRWRATWRPRIVSRVQQSIPLP